MKLFTRKQSKEIPEVILPQPQSQECQHKWQDFPWYITSSLSNDRYSIDVYEPYVCIFCGKRNDIKLAHYDGSGHNAYKQGKEAIDWLKRNFENHIRERIEIEDMVHDMQNVDREFLQWYHFLHGQKNPSTSSQPGLNKGIIELKL